jgi:signal transduction histidine kinase
MNPRSVLTLLDPAVGVWLVASGIVGRTRRPASRVGPLMMLAGVGWLAGAAVPALVFVHRGPLVHLHLSYPSGRLRRRRAVAVTVVVYAVSVFEGVARLPWLTLALSVWVVAVAVDTFARTTGAARKAAFPALGAALGFAGVLGVSALNRLFVWSLDAPLAVGYDAVVAIAVGVLLIDLLTGRWVDATVTDLVLALGSRTGVTGLRRQLRRALGDPTLELGLRLPGRTWYVDESGHELDLDALDPDRTMTPLHDEDGPVAVLVHDPVALDDPTLLTAVAAAARLTVANARMQDEIEGRAAELAATRRRIVETADVERRGLVEDLQQGAEQRLRAAEGILAELGPPDRAASDTLVDRIRAELTAAMDELGSLARGIRPPELTTGGLALAVPTLAGRAGLPVTTTVTVGRLPAAEEATLYFVSAEALANAAKHSKASRVQVEISESDGVVTAQVTDDGVGGADRTGSGLQGLVDRVHAVGGTLDVTDHAPHGTRLTVRLPRPPDDATEAGGPTR